MNIQTRKPNSMMVTATVSVCFLLSHPTTQEYEKIINIYLLKNRNNHIYVKLIYNSLENTLDYSIL